MSWLADAHRDWHTVNGANAMCPLDCGANEADEGYDDEQPALVRCGWCHELQTIDEVRACSTRHYAEAKGA